ncbi:MAG: formylglycine-generating enzyme family protein [Treponema sp.]|nr:formylglycine-generating enzyme family protein [Treponema sp.]
MKRILLLVCLVATTFSYSFAADKVKVKKEKIGNITYNMIRAPGTNLEMLSTEVTQELYAFIMGENPSADIDEESLLYPVDSVSYNDAIYFCNLLSMLKHYQPVYAVKGETDPKKWDYTPHQKLQISPLSIDEDPNANGYRLPTVEEWDFFAAGGENYKYSGSDDLDVVGWFRWNSKGYTHEVAQLEPNAYGMYDMSGNVGEICSDFYPTDVSEIVVRVVRGGFCRSARRYCAVPINDEILDHLPSHQVHEFAGFRFIRQYKK